MLRVSSPDKSVKDFNSFAESCWVKLDDDGNNFVTVEEFKHNFDPLNTKADKLEIMVMFKIFMQAMMRSQGKKPKSIRGLSVKNAD